MRFAIRMEGRTALLASYGAYAVTAALLGVLGFMIWLTRPVPTGGMRTDMSIVTWICTVVILAIVGAAHVALGRQLQAAARRDAARGRR